MNFKLNFLIFTFGMFSSCAVAQSGTYTSTNKKAIKAFEAGQSCYGKMDQFGKKDNECIEKNFKKALELDANFMEAYMMLAQHYMDTRQNEKAIEALKASHKANPKFFPNSWFLVAELEMKTGKYEEALKDIDAFYSFGKVHESIAEDAALIKANAEFAIEAMKHPIKFNPVNLGPEINTVFPEYFPAITGDDKTLLFTRRIKDENSAMGEQEDFYFSHKTEKGWTRAKGISATINSEYNEGAPTLSSDGRILIFTACSLIDDKDYGEGRDGHGSCDLFYCQRIGDNWTRPINMGNTINSYHWETQPSYSADGRTVYYIRGVRNKGGKRTGDIVFSTLDENNTWSAPKKLPDYINTVKDEASVLIHPDGQTLYFASNGHVGMGGYDLYMCRLQPDGTWSKPVNLGYPLNTWNDENSLLVASSGKVAFFASDRKGGFGDLDLYSFDMDESIRPVYTTYMQGVVYDSVSKQKLEAEFQLRDVATGKLVAESYSDRVTGEFLVNIATNKNYALSVFKPEYAFYSKKFTFMNEGEINRDKVFNIDIPLQPLTPGTRVVLENIFFDTDKYDLKPESVAELDKFVEFMTINSKLKIELHGHTDTDGDDKHNLTLSQNRAKAVMDYLISKGIAKERLSAKGWGESMPIATNSTPEGKARNRRTEYVIVK